MIKLKSVVFTADLPFSVSFFGFNPIPILLTVRFPVALTVNRIF